MTLPPFAKDRDALQVALNAFERDGRDCDPRVVKKAVIDVLTEVRFRLAGAFLDLNSMAEFKSDMQAVIDNAEYAFNQAIEDAESPDTRAATEADMNNKLNRESV